MMPQQRFSDNSTGKKGAGAAGIEPLRQTRLKHDMGHARLHYYTHMTGGYGVLLKGQAQRQVREEGCQQSPSL